MEAQRAKMRPKGPPTKSRAPETTSCFTIFDNDVDNTEEEEKESKQVDQMDEMKEGFPEFGHKSSFYTRKPPLLAFHTGCFFELVPPQKV